MFCLAPACSKPVISLDLASSISNVLPQSACAAIVALAEKYVAANDPPPGRWPSLHYAMRRVYRKDGITTYLRRWMLAHGTLPEGVHDVLWNKGEDCMEIDFTRLQNDPNYPIGIWHPDYQKRSI